MPTYKRTCSLFAETGKRFVCIFFGLRPFFPIPGRARESFSMHFFRSPLPLFFLSPAEPGKRFVCIFFGLPRICRARRPSSGSVFYAFLRASALLSSPLAEPGKRFVCIFTPPRACIWPISGRALGSPGQLRAPLGSCGQLWAAPGSSGQLWTAVGSCGQFWAAVGSGGQLWAALQC